MQCEPNLFSSLAAFQGLHAVKYYQTGRGSGLQGSESCTSRACPTKRAPDAGDSAAFPSLFLRLSIFPVGRRSAARPSAGNANRWAHNRRITNAE
jgi:hypothetical protein